MFFLERFFVDINVKICQTCFKLEQNGKEAKRNLYNELVEMDGSADSGRDDKKTNIAKHYKR